MSNASQGKSMSHYLPLIFALCTVSMWGVYGVFLHKGQVLMNDNVNGRYKAFLVVGFAYFVIAVLGPALLLLFKKGGFSMTGTGITWSFIAGAVGAIGAFCVLLAFGSIPKGESPGTWVPVIMAVIFAGAPIVNAFVSIYQHRQELGPIHPLFVVGLLMAAAGTALVAWKKPKAKVSHSPAPPAVEAPLDSSN